MTALDPTAPLVAVRAFDETADPAVDWEATDREAYRKSRDPEKLVLLPGQKPARFHIRRLPAPFVLSELEATASTGEKTLLAVCAAVYRVELPSGQALTPAKTSKRAGVDLAEVEWCTTLRDHFGINTLYEMAALAIRHASLPVEQRGPFA